MKNKEKMFEEILESYQNGNISQAIEQIEEYRFNSFIFDLKEYKEIDDTLKIDLLNLCIRHLADKAGVK